MINGLVKMVTREGVLVPYKGLLPALIQNAPLLGISFATHGLIKSYLDTSGERRLIIEIYILIYT